MRKVTPAKERKIWGTHPNIFFLGLVSFFTDVSTEMIFTILPLFLSNVLGVKTTIIGLVEGVADSTATLSKIVSGWLSDRARERKLFSLIGYGLSTIAKPFMYLATAWIMVLGIRFADRLGKGIRTAPRDALIADSAQVSERGKSFGLHRAMDSLGAVVGLGIAAIVVFLLQRQTISLTFNTYRTLVLIGIVPAVLAVFILFFFVHEQRRRLSSNGASKSGENALPNSSPPPWEKEGNKGGEIAKQSLLQRLSSSRGSKRGSAPLPNLSPSPWKGEGDKGGEVAKQSKQGCDNQFKVFLAIMVIFTLGNSSDAFLILRAQNMGASIFHIILMLVLFNIVYTLVSFPGGILSDKLGRKGVIALGWAIYAGVYLGFALSSSLWQMWLLFAIYGLYYGATEGVARALVADMVTAERRGTAYGIYHGAVGITILPASLIAGWLWQAFTPQAPFFLGAGLAGVATIALMAFIRK